MLKVLKSLLVMTIIIISLGVTTSRSEDGPFNIYLSLKQGIVINTLRNLVFPDTMIPTSTQDIVVATSDPGAAEIEVKGGPNRWVISFIVNNTVSLSAPGNSTNITVNNFTRTGGFIMNLGPSGETAFRIGATARIEPSTEDGNYSGSNIFRVIYF
jgi:hypothetical protein